VREPVRFQEPITSHPVELQQLFTKFYLSQILLILVFCQHGTKQQKQKLAINNIMKQRKADNSKIKTYNTNLIGQSGFSLEQLNTKL